MAGALRYEFVMQARRWVVWVIMLLVSGLTFLAGANEWPDFARMPGKEVAILWALHANFLLPVGFGVLIADRLVRDRRTNVEALLSASPGSALARLSGKFLGATLATVLPLLLVYLGGLGAVFSQSHDPQVLWWALPAFAAINLPGLLCIGAFSQALPAVMGVAFYQVLFVGYYLWGNDLPLTVGIPTLSHTILTPAGEYRAGGFFGIVDPTFHATLSDALLSTALMLVSAAIAVVGVSWFLAWQQARQ
jgi:hypothetical protein